MLINTTRVHNYDEVEIETLLLKLRLESSGVDFWIFLENDYTFSGEYKGYTFEELIRHDLRFRSYRHRIHVIESSFNSRACETSDRQERMSLTWKSEAFLKDSAVPFLLQHCSDDDWITVADADEMIDFTDERRASKVESFLKDAQGPVFLPMVRYWYDYDNLARGRGYSVLPMWLIRKHNSIKNAYDDYKHEAAVVPSPEELVAFEYCACCGKDRILEKIQTVPFYYHTMEDFEEAFRCNYWPKAKQVGEVVRSPQEAPDNWFETVELDEYNSPAYVRENLAELKTHNIDPNYKENRKIYFPQWFK